MDILELKQKNVAILGVGIEGFAVLNFLLDKVNSITLFDKFNLDQIVDNLGSTEGKKLKELIRLEKVKYLFGEKYLDSLNSFDLIIRSPGISYFHPKIQEAINNGCEVSSQIKLFFELCPCKIIGVSGTKGKGTTSSLIYEVLKRACKEDRTNVYIAGNIGYPAITLIPNLRKEDIVILELSSFQLMDLEKSPDVAVMTNLSVDHLDYHRDLMEYRTAKFNLLKHQKENQYAVLNFDSTYEEVELKNIRSKIVYFSKRNEKCNAVVQHSGDSFEVVLDPDSRNIKICDENEIKLFGLHNLENIAAAALVADILNVKIETIKEGVKQFQGLPHRIEYVSEIDGIKYINDSYATNPDPTMAAINSFKEDKVLILGGSSKGADFSSLAERISKSNTKAVVLIGVEGPRIRKALELFGYQGQMIDGGNSIDEIVDKAKKVAKRGDIILLSPACASFGMFKNYKDRGERFKREVLTYPKICS